MPRFDLAADRLDLRALLDLADAARRLDVDLNLRPWLIGPYVAGLEVTQAIQYYRADRHLTNADDRGADNAVRLVAKKPAWVRVYVSSGLLGGSQTLAGDLLVESRTGPLLIDWQPVATLAPQPPGSVTSQSNPTYAAERGTLGATLNFIIGGDLLSGVVRLTARIWRVGDATRTVVDTWQETVDATLLQTLRLRGVFVHYNGPDPTVNAANPPTVDLPAPTLADLQATAAWTFTTNPVQSQGVFSSAGTMNWFAPLTGVATTPGGCSSDWYSFNFWLSLIKNNDGNRSDVIYYGLLPASTPIANVGGCESSGVSAGPNGQQQTMAHEVGHGAGLQHAPCNVPGDPSYPAYEPYDPANTPTASIGEYGLDITNGAIHPPTDKDYMSYCGPAWISLYHHGRLWLNDAFDPRFVGTRRWQPPDLVDPYLWPWEYIPDPPPWERVTGVRQRAEPVISLLGIVDDQGVLEVRSVMRVQALRHTPGASSTRYVAQLVGASGAVVASAPVVQLESRGGGCGCRQGGAAERPDRGYVFEAMLPDVEPGAELRILRRSGDPHEEDEAIWARWAPSRPPRIAAFDVRIRRGEGIAAWEAGGAADCALEYSLQFSKDDGRSWNSLAVGLRGTRHRFPLADLPSGPCVFRVLAHDGFHSASATSGAVELPRRPPTISILHPLAERPLDAGAAMRLWGQATDDDGTPVDPERCAWRVDDREAGRGGDAFVVAPEPGEHRCTFTVAGGGGVAETSVVFRTIDPGAQEAGATLPPPAPSTPGTRRRGRGSAGRSRRGRR